MPLASSAPLQKFSGRPLFAPAGGQRAAGKMRARRMRRKVKSLAVAAEFLRIAPGPGDRAAHLLIHRQQIAAGLFDIDEVDDDGMRAGANERLGLERVIGRLVATPGAAMDEDVDRRVRRGATKNIELFVFAGPIGDALRRSENSPRPLARRNSAGNDPIAIGRIDGLVIGVVERLLVHVEPDERPFGFPRRGGRRSQRIHAHPSIIHRVRRYWLGV